jgi:uncharacterized membrane protein affecting hemolysin expression
MRKRIAKAGNFVRGTGTYILFVLVIVFATLFSWITYGNYQAQKKVVDKQIYELSTQTANQVYLSLKTNVEIAVVLEPAIDDQIKLALNRIAQDYPETSLMEMRENNRVSDIYIIDKDFIIRETTDPEQLYFDTRVIYDEVHGNDFFEDKVRKLQAQPGTVWIDGFNPSKTDTTNYSKWAYMSMDDGRILEVSVSIADVLRYTKAQTQSEVINSFLMMRRDTIKDIKIYSEQTDKEFKNPSGKIISQKELSNGNIETVVAGNFFRGNRSAITVITDFEVLREHDKDIKQSTWFSIYMTVMLTVTILLAIYSQMRGKKSNEN